MHEGIISTRLGRSNANSAKILLVCLCLAVLPQRAFGFGQVIGWGNAKNVPATASNSIAISAGYYNLGYHYALRSDGTIVSWDNSGVLPTPSGLSNVMEIAAGYWTGGIALRTDGRAVGWGSSAEKLAALNTLSNLVSVEKDDLGFTCLRADGSVARIRFSSVTNPPSLTNVVALYPFNYGYIALRANGTYFVDSEGSINASPSTNVMTLAAGGYRAGQGLLLRRDGSLVGWGNPTNAPLAGTNFIDVAASQYGKFVLRADGTVAGWSSSFSPDVLTNFPPGLTNIISIVGGENSMIALRMTNRISHPVSLSSALNTSALVVSSKGSSQWFTQTNVTHDGAFAARSGPVGNGTASSMRLWTNGPVEVSFWWKTSSETNKDVLTFSAGTFWLTNISGESGWQQCTAITPPGPQLLQWTYAKDNSGSAGQDAAWVDQISITRVTNPPPFITLHPPSRHNHVNGNIHVTKGTIVTFYVSAASESPLGYQWWKNGNPIPNATTNYITLLNVTRAQSGVYSAVVTNSAGSATSSNATLIVHAPQRITAPIVQLDGTIVFESRDVDGVPLQSNDLSYLQAQASTNLVQWTALPGALTLTNGLLRLHDPDSINLPRRFYRLLEDW